MKSEYYEPENYNLLRPSFLIVLNELRDKPIRAVEIGSFYGKNADIMLDSCPNLSLVMVDIKITDDCKKVIEKHKGRVEVLEETSASASRRFKDKTFNYVYIDGGHEEDDVYTDLVCWHPKLKLYGIMGGHDWWYDGVKKGMKKFVKQYPQVLYGVEKYFPQNIPSKDAQFMDWWFRKLYNIVVEKEWEYCG